MKEKNKEIMCVCETERKEFVCVEGGVREGVCVCVGRRDRQSVRVCVKGKEREGVCACEKEKQFECVCVCEGERERKRAHAIRIPIKFYNLEPKTSNPNHRL